MSMGASAVSPHFPQRREASHGGHRPPRFLFSNALRGAPAVNLPAAVSLSGERGCAGDPIAARTPGGAVDGAMERSADNGIRFVRPPQLRRRGLLCPGMMVETITIAGREHFDSGYCGPLHLLIAHEQLSRRRGVTCIEGLPYSTRENLAQTLTFVPAGSAVSRMARSG